jgi:hypothetical protein
MPAMAPIAAARPHPSEAMCRTEIPESPADVGFCAAALIPSPSVVNRKNAHNSASIAAVTTTIPSWCADRMPPRNEKLGNGLGKSRTSYPQR